ncbi:MAG: hypothetical protein MJE68_11400, partial [Proteobacteria bacterium]|nr:hypothetical protein [Pseudomonadota bacterium]
HHQQGALFYVLSKIQKDSIVDTNDRILGLLYIGHGRITNTKLLSNFSWFFVFSKPIEYNTQLVF